MFPNFCQLKTEVFKQKFKLEEQQRAITISHLLLSFNCRIHLINANDHVIFILIECFSSIIRSSHLRCFVKKGPLKNFTGKHLSWSLFFITLQGFLYPLKTGKERPAILLKREFNVGVSSGYRKACNFHRIPPGGCFCRSLQ